jgi:hypothetical protein
MTQYYAQANANWDAANQWSTNAGGGAGTYGTPTVGDSCEANNYTTAINVDVNLGTGTLTNASGGGFTVDTTASDRSVTANATASAVTLVTWTVSASYTLTWVGNITGGSATGAKGLAMTTGSCKLAMTGCAKGGSAATTYGVSFAGGTAGNNTISNPGGIACWGGSFSSAYGLFSNCGTSDVLNIVGEIRPGANSAGMGSGGKVYHTGSLVQIANSCFPVVIGASAKYFWEGADGTTCTFYDSSGTAHVLKVPQYPDAANVVIGSGTYDYGTYTPSYPAYPANIVEKEWVVVGHYRYDGGDEGTYPTTTTSQAAQLATDQAAVAAVAASISTTVTDLLGTVDGTLDLSLYVLRSKIVMPPASVVMAGWVFGEIT